MQSLLPKSRYEFKKLTYSPDGSILAGNSTGQVTFWDPETRGILHRSGYVHRGRATCTAFGGKYFVSGGNDKTAIVWDLDTFKEVNRFTSERPFRDVTISQDGRYLVGADSRPIVYLWDIRTGELLFTKKYEDGVTTDRRIQAWINQDASRLFVRTGRNLLTGSCLLGYGTSQTDTPV